MVDRFTVGPSDVGQYSIHEKRWLIHHGYTIKLIPKCRLNQLAIDIHRL